METKSELRARMLAGRCALPPEDARDKAARIHARLYRMEAFQRASAVLTYVSSKQNEVDTLGVIENLLKHGRRIACPRAIANGTLTWLVVGKLSDLVPGTFGVLEPDAGACPVADFDADAVALVPGIAFTRYGDRLGYGKGYFDRFLASFPGTSIGLAYDCQIVESIPREAHDVRVKALITESMVYETRG